MTKHFPELPKTITVTYPRAGSPQVDLTHRVADLGAARPSDVVLVLTVRHIRPEPAADGLALPGVRGMATVVFDAWVMDPPERDGPDAA